MIIKDLFAKDINRDINGVVKLPRKMTQLPGRNLKSTL